MSNVTHATFPLTQPSKQGQRNNWELLQMLVAQWEILYRSKALSKIRLIDSSSTQLLREERKKVCLCKMGKDLIATLLLSLLNPVELL